MRRGLMAWSEAELPAAALDARVGALAASAGRAGLGAVLVNTNISRPADVSWLTGFTPYWNQGVLVVTPDAGVVFVCALSQRVAEWIKSVSRMDAVLCTPDIGGGVAKRLAGNVPVGVVNLPDFPAGHLDKLRGAHPGLELREAAGLLAQARRTVAEGGAIGDRLATIAADGLRAGLDAAASGDGNAAGAAAERSCRLAGAEEVLVAVAPDLERDGRLRRMEGACPLGARFALQLSVAYKGEWCRVACSTVRDGALPGWMAAADAWLTALPVSPRAPGRALAVPPEGAAVEAWRIEGPARGMPLGVLAGSAPFDDAAELPPGRHSLFVRLRSDDGWWAGARTLPIT